jgi:penicillin-binding protein 1A
VFTIFAVGTAGFFWVGWAPCQLGGCAPVGELAGFHAEGSEILDRYGEPFARLATVDRRLVSLDSLPPFVPRAFIAIEDRRFYRHGGIDLWRTAGALVSNLKARRVGEGGSTITQQLARNLFPDWLPHTERNLRRKLLEARAARQIERTFTKDKILELYLNHIYLGSGAWGIEAASRRYFGKPASQLTLSEAATLAGLPKSPSEINPRANLERATERRNLVLSQMVEAGYLDAATADRAQAEPLRVARETEDDDALATGGSYFVEQVRRELEERVGHRIYTAGLRIHTGFDPAIQAAAEEEMERQMRVIESGPYGEYRHPRYSAERSISDARSGTEYLQGAVVVLDARTGELLALVGGRDFRDSKFNRATQARRQAGSLFKPFVYAAALERYRSPLHTVEDRPVRVTMPNGEIWRPRNFSGRNDGTITLRDALARSNNVATVRLALDVGIGQSVEIARDLGITTPIPVLPSVALGAAEVRPIEVTAAYAAFANGGHRVEPHLIREIVDREGRVVWRPRSPAGAALSPATAFLLTSILQDAIDFGTGAAARASGFTGIGAGKTGTTNEEADVWFVGYTPELVAGVWMGLDRPATIIDGASGGTLAAPLWGRMMARIYANRPPSPPWRARGSFR